MPPWRTPESGREFTVKFLRLEDCIYVGDTISDGHSDIALIDGIEVEIDLARVRDNLSVDGGILNVKGGDIFISGNSGSLQLPVLGREIEARQSTLKVFRDQNPGFNVVDEQA